MIHGYHVIMPHYGFWLPNDPRGSWSQFVARWELARFGRTTRNLQQRTIAQLSDQEVALREAARKALLYPPVTLTGQQALSVANGFRSQSLKRQYTICACAIMPEHTHLVIGRHRYKVEQVANLLKGAATKQLVDDGQHPMTQHATAAKRPPAMWARHQWRVYLDSEQAIENAINYVNENPLKEAKPAQRWSWIAPFGGLSPGLINYA